MYFGQSCFIALRTAAYASFGSRKYPRWCSFPITDIWAMYCPSVSYLTLLKTRASDLGLRFNHRSSLLSPFLWVIWNVGRKPLIHSQAMREATRFFPSRAIYRRPLLARTKLMGFHLLLKNSPVTGS